MDHPFNATTSLRATASCDELTNTMRIDVLGSLNQDSRPSLVHMIHDLRSSGIQSHVRVDLSQAVLVESTALAGLRQDLNALEGASGTAGNGVSLALTGDEAARQPEDSANARHTELSDGPDDEFAAAFENTLHVVSHPALVALPDRPLEEYSDDELFAASDAVFSLLDDPGTVRGADLLGQYNDIGQEIGRRSPLSELLNPAAVDTSAESQPAG
jgi:hypothetical protein